MHPQLNASEIEELFLRSQKRDYKKEMLRVEFSGAKADKVSVRPGRGDEMTIDAVIESHRSGIYFPDSNLGEVRKYVKDNPQSDRDVSHFFGETLKKLSPYLEKKIADYFEDPRQQFHLLWDVFGKDADDWENVSNVKVIDVKIGKPKDFAAPWSARVTFTATKKVGEVAAAFSEMSDRELDGLIDQLRYESPHSFSDDDYQMSEADFHKKYRENWRSMPPRGQQSLLKSLQSGYYRVASNRSAHPIALSANRIAAAFMTANPEMDPDQAMNQRRLEFPNSDPSGIVLAGDEVTAGSDGNYMTKQNLFLLHRMSEMLYKGIPHGMLLPDWAESKINSAAEHMKSVAGWAMYESHGDDLHHGPEANPIHLASRYLSAQESRLDPKVKSLVNKTLIRAGLDGNKRFRTPSEALSRANNALSEHGLEWDEVINSFMLNQPKGRINVSLALTNQADPFSPTSVGNTSLAFFWDTLETGVEAVAYLG